MAELKSQISEETKTAMKARDKGRVAALRMINAEIKRIEVDERRELGDDDVLQVLTRMLKQRRDALSQFEEAGRDDLAQQERFELDLLKVYMPEQLGADELTVLIGATIEQVGAESMRDMGAVMNAIREQVQGRADMKAVSQAVREQLSA